jgi:hypothetical protein
VGTMLVKNIAQTRTVGRLLTTNGKVFFTGDYFNVIGYQGGQLFATDGTAAGTGVMGNLSINDTSQLTVANGEAYVLSYRNSISTLWRSDGTTAGTALEASFGSAGGSIWGVYAFGNTLYLSANDGTHGAELMTINLNDTYNGTSAVNTITLTRNADNTHIDWTDGTTSGQVLINSPNGLTLNGGGNNDVINLVNTPGNPLPAVLHLDGTFTISGLTGTNPLINTTLEIGTGTIYLNYAGPAADPLASVTGYLKNGYDSGAWKGSATASTGAIVSTAAAGMPAHNVGIGYADSADGLVPLPANTIELKYTLYGDTGLTGSVGFTDFMRMTQHYTLAAGATWGAGDFNYDGAVNSTDFNLLQPNYGTTLPAPAPNPVVESPMLGRPPRTAQLPPPTDLGLASVNSTVQTSAGVDAVALPKSKRLLVKAHASRKRH